ncbi:MAG TPA: ComF family protein [Terriglobia bacterium]|nr:ComF family protein [Terriglobia bacterium]
MASQFGESLLALVFPSRCVLCKQELRQSLVGGICGDCWCTLESWTGSVCTRCGLPLAANVDTPKFLCADCRRSGYPFDAARSFGVYGGSLRAAVLELKFHGHEGLGTRLGRLLLQPWMALEVAACFEGPALIIPVPLHRSKERERGYNQATVIARGLWRTLRDLNRAASFRFERRFLVRWRSSAPQSGLSLHARQENVRGAFAVVAPERVEGRDVVLVDDVMTTGATASACTSALKRAGARRVAVLTLARATPQFPDLAPVCPSWNPARRPDCPLAAVDRRTPPRT